MQISAFFLLLTGALTTSCATASGPAPISISSTPPKLGRCGGYITLNLTKNAITKEEIEYAKKYCELSKDVPCLELLTKRESDSDIIKCKEYE